MLGQLTHSSARTLGQDRCVELGLVGDENDGEILKLGKRIAERAERIERAARQRGEVGARDRYQLTLGEHGKGRCVHQQLALLGLTAAALLL